MDMKFFSLSIVFGVVTLLYILFLFDNQAKKINVSSIPNVQYYEELLDSYNIMANLIVPVWIIIFSLFRYYFWQIIQQAFLYLENY